MSDDNDTRGLEARLQSYGDVLRDHLDATATTDTGGTVLIGGFGADPVGAPSRTRRRPTAAILMVAAAGLAVVGLLVPSLVAGDTGAPITMTGGETAAQPETDGPDGDAGDDRALSQAGDNGDEQHVLPGTDGKADGGKSTDELDWSSFSVRVTTAGDDDEPEAAGPASPKDDRGNDDGKADPLSTGDAALNGENEAAESNDEPTGCPDGAVKRDGACVKIGPPPTESKTECPDGAVQLDTQCYKVVPPSCGELPTAPNGDGCLKLVGSAESHGACTSPYVLNDTGTRCVKHVPAQVSCSQGSPSGDGCLIQQPATVGSGGCVGDTVRYGDGCYELTTPSSDCGELAPTGDGLCRQPVEPEHSSGCPGGFEQWDDVCFRYEAPPTYSCAAGVLEEGKWCRVESAPTPGPTECGDGVLQDGSGCYVLVAKNGDGTCGELPEYDGQCRKDKPGSPTWTCPGGKVVHEPACVEWHEAHAGCAAGTLHGDDCKTITDPVTGTSCPDYALQDGQGCYKVKPPRVGCGDLHVAPDGERCKRWVSEADGASSCPAGFDFHGEKCKKYVDGTYSCPGGDLVEAGGKAKCRYTTAPREPGAGCASGTIEKDGKCYAIVAPRCDGLETDLYGGGCKKPIPTGESTLTCRAGYLLVERECIKKLE